MCIFRKLSLFWFFTAFFALVFCIQPAFSAEEPVASAVHNPPEYFTSGFRIRLEIAIQDKNGVDTARCYFRAKGADDYVFVPLRHKKDYHFNAILPIPSMDTEQIAYRFLWVNFLNEVVKTQVYTIPARKILKLPDWQRVNSTGNIPVSTDLSEKPKTLSGFTDTITIETAEPSARFGIVAGGIYDKTPEGDAAAEATNAGVITAVSKGDPSPGTIVGIGIGVAALAGGVAIGAKNSGDDDDSDSHAAGALPRQKMTTSWDVDGYSNDEGTITGSMTLMEGGNCTYSLTETSSDREVKQFSGAGTWDIDHRELTLYLYNETVFTGIVHGDAEKFTLPSTNNAWILNFQRR